MIFLKNLANEYIVGNNMKIFCRSGAFWQVRWPTLAHCGQWVSRQLIGSWSVLPCGYGCRVARVRRGLGKIQLAATLTWQFIEDNGKGLAVCDHPDAGRRKPASGYVLHRELTICCTGKCVLKHNDIMPVGSVDDVNRFS